MASVAVHLWRGLTGDRAAVLSPPSAAELMASARERYERFTDDGAPAPPPA